MLEKRHIKAIELAINHFHGESLRARKLKENEDKYEQYLAECEKVVTSLNHLLDKYNRYKSTDKSI